MRFFAAIRERRLAGGVLLLVFFLSGCATGLRRARQTVHQMVTPTEVAIIRHHLTACFQDLETFTSRLYAKNPKYEPDKGQRARKLRRIFHDGPPPWPGCLNRAPSHRLLTAAFAAEPPCPDRVYLLVLGLAKSFREAYGLPDNQPLLSGLQIPLERLERLHHNLSQVNWRLKTYRDGQGELLFRTNEAGRDGYLNMGYEVIMTRLLTRVEDDIFLRGGLPNKYLFSMSTYFLSIVTSPF